MSPENASTSKGLYGAETTKAADCVKMLMLRHERQAEDYTHERRSQSCR